MKTKKQLFHFNFKLSLYGEAHGYSKSVGWERIFKFMAVEREKMLMEKAFLLPHNNNVESSVLYAVCVCVFVCTIICMFVDSEHIRLGNTTMTSFSCMTF